MLYVATVYNWQPLLPGMRVLGEADGFGALPDCRIGIMRGQTSQPEIVDALASGDYGLLLREDNATNRTAAPTKFAEYCAAGVPVVTTPYVGDVTRLVDAHNIGIVIEPVATTSDVGLPDIVP